MFSFDLWYQPIYEYIYVIIWLSMKGDDFSHFLNLYLGIVGENLLAYVQIYVSMKNSLTLVISILLVATWIYIISL